MRTSMVLVLVLLVGALPGCGQKRAPAPAPLTAEVEALPTDKGYRVVTGAELKKLRGDLLGHKIAFSGSLDFHYAGTGQTVLLSPDKQFRVEFGYKGNLALNSVFTIPQSLIDQLASGGIKEGNVITVYATVVEFKDENGPPNHHEAAVVNPVDDWKRGR